MTKRKLTKVVYQHYKWNLKARLWNMLTRLEVTNTFIPLVDLSKYEEEGEEK